MPLLQNHNYHADKISEIELTFSMLDFLWAGENLAYVTIELCCKTITL